MTALPTLVDLEEIRQRKNVFFVNSLRANRSFPKNDQRKTETRITYQVYRAYKWLEPELFKLLYVAKGTVPVSPDQDR